MWNSKLFRFERRETYEKKATKKSVYIFNTCIYSIVCSFSKENENEKKRSFVSFSPFIFALK
jgi:hypothetical protein